MELGTTLPHWFLPPGLRGEEAGAAEASSTSCAVLTLEESLFDLLFIKVCILKCPLGPQMLGGQVSFCFCPPLGSLGLES